MSFTKDQAARAASINLDSLGPLRPGAAATQREPRTAPGQLMDLQAKYQEALATIERLSKGGVPMEVPLNRLIRVPGRQRPLTPEERAELKANLKANPLIHPVTILPETEEGFELLSGYNRADLYEELGRTSILAVVIHIPKEMAEVLAFYANLAPALPDYKKYEGLKTLQASTGFDQTQLSEASGMSSSTVSRLFQFEELPADAHEILRRNPFILGASAASGLAKATKAGRADLVVEAVTKLAEAAADPEKKMRFTEENAVAHANGARPPAAKPAAAAPLVVKQGKKNFAKLVTRGNQVTVQFADPSVSAEEWATKFEAFLKSEIAKEAE